MELKIGLIGTGTVGGGVLDIIQKQNAVFQSKTGINIQVSKICAKTNEELNSIDIPSAKKTTLAESLCQDPDIQVIVELAGGYDLPKKWISQALSNGKHVVTANKALLAKYGPELFPLAQDNNCFLKFEAAIGGGIPIVKAIQESLIANPIQGVACIINGTCNYILSEMATQNQEYQSVLEKAQALGYAEANPVFDVEGVDSAHKVALLAALSSRKYVDFEEMSVEGISSISSFDIRTASDLGYQIKLLGIITVSKQGLISANVYPALLPKSHLLASVNGVLNAVYIKTSFAGNLLFTGAGAGRYPTASAVVSDIIAIGEKIKNSETHSGKLGFINRKNKSPLIPIGELETEFYLRLTTKDETGVLAKITNILAKYDISINSILQKTPLKKDCVPIVIITYTVKNRALISAVSEIDALDVVTAETRYLRFYQ